MIVVVRGTNGWMEYPQDWELSRRAHIWACRYFDRFHLYKNRVTGKLGVVSVEEFNDILNQGG